MALNFFHRIRAAVTNLRFVPLALGLVWQAVPGWTAFGSVLIVLQGLLPALVVYLTKLVVDRIVAATAAGGSWILVSEVFWLGGAIGGALLLNEILSSLSRWVRVAQTEHLQDHIRSLIHRQAIAADLAFYEQPDYYDHLHRARDESATRSAELITSLGQLVQSAITLIAMGAVLLPYGPWLPLALLLSTGPAFLVVLRFSLRQHDWRRVSTADERRTWYFDWLLTGAEAAPELRLFGLGPFFRARYAQYRSGLRAGKLKLARDQGAAELLAAVLALTVTGGVMIWMIWRVVHGRGTFGDLALFYQAFYQGQGLMRTLLGNLGQLYANSLFLGDLFAYLELQPRVLGLDPVFSSTAPNSEVEFDHVTFTYHGASRPALRDFSLKIPAGQIAAIVGANGAGKTTLIKLLCRFYDPQAGTVAVGGTDVRSRSLDEVRGMMTVLFQQPMHYSATVAENIAVGSDAASIDQSKIRTAARAAGANEVIDRLPQQYDQLLGLWFAGGAELSAGEWQRVALARAFLRDTPILLLDEPTSAMDPWAEADWLDRFRAFAQNKTAIIITHRFTTARYADVIHVVDDGSIIESGTHEELLARNGRYAESWAAQTGASAHRRQVSTVPRT